MNKHLVVRKYIAAIFTAGLLVTLTFVTPNTADAQSTAEKIQLMAEALRARDAGNLDLAKAKAEELNKIAPDDKNAKRLLDSINEEMGVQANIAEEPTEAAAEKPKELATEEPIEVAVEEPETVVVVEKPKEAKKLKEKKEKKKVEDSVDSVLATVVADQNAKIEAARAAIPEALKLANLGAFDEGLELLDSKSSELPLNTTTKPVLAEIEQTKNNILEMQTSSSVIEVSPYALPISEISPDYVAQSQIIDELLTRGRAQYLNGDYDGAATTFKEVEARDANNAEAKLFQTRIAEILGKVHEQNFYKTREQMLTEVDQSWERPKVFDVDKEVSLNDVEDSGILKQMKDIVIPQVNFSGMELTRVIDTLSELSVEYDPAKKGVNIVPLFDPNERNPRVNISLRNLNLDLILKFVTQQVNFSYDVGGDAVTVDFTDSVGGESSNLTEFFPISRATIIRLIGIRDGGSGSVTSTDPFAEPIEEVGSNANDDTDALKKFFQSAGVNFDLPGADLAFDGEQLIVTQTSRNLERMRVILRNYNEIKQVEIEAKFLEVSQGDLEELGFDWNLSKDGDTIFQFGSESGTRNIAGAFGVDQDSSQIVIDNPGQAIVIPQGANPPVILESDGFSNSVPFAPPNITNAVDLGTDVVLNTFEKAFNLGNYDADFAIRALSRKTGSDLMSAPKVTVLSGKRATITVAQELRYPESYGDIEAEVSAGVDGSGGAGGAGIAITAGTPQDFISRNVGVEMSVTPNVENDDTISLILEPRVTEFEGFVEYGGPSVAIQGGTTVTVPSGFYQPIFSTREVTTEVTVFDGATIVMGGLTRDEVKTVKDKVPVLGDIPGIGRLFRSEGETRLKRNLLIFVTANLVSPGGSPANQDYRNVKANSLFQNPTIMTPSGTVNRSIEAPTAE